MLATFISLLGSLAQAQFVWTGDINVDFDVVMSDGSVDCWGFAASLPSPVLPGLLPASVKRLLSNEKRGLRKEAPLVFGDRLFERDMLFQAFK